MLSDALKEYGAGKRDISPETLRMLAYACLTPAHAGMFLAFTKNIRNQHMLDDIIAKEAKWPSNPEDRDVLYFLAQSFRAKLLQELPKQAGNQWKYAFIYIQGKGNDKGIIRD